MMDLHPTEYYHGEDVGCIIHKYLLKRLGYGDNATNKTIDVSWCDTHKLLTCRCGYLFKHHFKHTERNKHRVLEEYYEEAPENLKEKIRLTWEYYDTKL